MAATPRVVIHQPEHRRRSIAIEPDPLATQAYDHNVAAYFEFLACEARKHGYEVTTDTRENTEAMYNLEAQGDDKRALHDWFAQQPDIWNWLPAADERGAPPGRSH
jgi:hypothetical protein